MADVKTVVLINEDSASASEITAGALREYGKAKIVGQKSYGKGSVQRLVKFSSGAQMKITEARWYTPQGKNIDKAGIEPDEKVEMTMDDVNNNRDPQLEKAKKSVHLPVQSGSNEILRRMNRRYTREQYKIGRAHV